MTFVEWYDEDGVPIYGDEYPLAHFLVQKDGTAKQLHPLGVPPNQNQEIRGHAEHWHHSTQHEGDTNGIRSVG